MRSIASIAGSEWRSPNYFLLTFLAALLLTVGAVAGIYGWRTFQRMAGRGIAVPVLASKTKNEKGSDATHATSATRIKRNPESR